MAETTVGKPIGDIRQEEIQGTNLKTLEDITTLISTLDGVIDNIKADSGKAAARLLIQDYEDRLVNDQVLTDDGVQWSTEHTTSTDIYETAFTKVIDPGVNSAADGILWMEFGLTCAVKSSSTAESVLFKWQAKNSGGTWTDLHTEVTYAADASSYAEYTRQGYFKHANVDQVPLEVQLLVKSGSAGGENALAKVKSSSYVRVVYKAV